MSRNYSRMMKPVRLLRAVDLHVGPDVRGILLISMAVIVIWFFVGRVNGWLLPLRMRTAEAKMGVIEEIWNGRAFAVRAESVIHSPASGRITLLVSEGQRVRAGDIICEVNSAGETGALPADLDKLNELMKTADADVLAARRNGARRRAEVTAKLEDLRQQMRMLQDAGKLEQVQKKEGEERVLEAKLRAVAAAEAEAVLQADMRRQELLRRRETVLGGTSSDVYLVRAAAAGIVSFQQDGLENALTLDAPLHDVATVGHDLSMVKRADGERVSAGAPLFRLVNTSNFYLYISVDGPRPLVANEYMQADLKGQSAQMRVGRAEERPNSRSLALLAADTFRPDFLYHRQLDIKLSRGRKEGVVVPASSIVSDKNNQSGVFLMVDRTPVYRAVKVTANNRVVALVDGVPLGARVVTNPGLLRKKWL